MDGQRFDSLARMIARRDSRRGLLRGLAGALALLALDRRALSVAAQTGYLGPGEACYDDSQCAPFRWSAMVCADNGFDYDGPFNCCAGEGGLCGSDEGCCGAAVCIDSACTSGSVYAGPGDPCQNSGQCVAADTALYCDYVAATDDYRCCALEGSRCGWDGGCCGWLTCGADGFCTSASPSSCTGWGCGCDPNNAFGCDPGLICCSSGGGSVCASAEQCGFVTCSGVGCSCVSGAYGACDAGMVCCAQGDPGALGTCLPVDACNVSLSACTWEGCECAVHDPYACGGDMNLVCCGPFEPGATGTCQRRENC